MGKKLFVGGLSWDTTEESLKAYFEAFGQITSCSLKTDMNTGKSRGFGFVEFTNSSSITDVLGQSSHSLDGRFIHPKPATGQEPVLKVFVGGVDPGVPEDDIRQHFEQFGTVDEINLPYDKMKNQRRAFCFVKFDSEDVVAQVIAQPKQTLGGQEVDVKKVTPKPQDGGGFGGGGRGGYSDGGRGGRGGRRGGGYSQSYGGGGSSRSYSSGGAYGSQYESYDDGYGAGGYGRDSYSSGGAGGYGGAGKSYHPYQRY